MAKKETPKPRRVRKPVAHPRLKPLPCRIRVRVLGSDVDTECDGWTATAPDGTVCESPNRDVVKAFIVAHFPGRMKYTAFGRELVRIADKLDELDMTQSVLELPMGFEGLIVWLRAEARNHPAPKPVRTVKE